MLGTFRKAFTLIGREYRGRWILLVAIAVFASGLEVLAAALVFVMIGLVTTQQAGLSLPFVGDLSEGFGDTSDGAVLLWLVAGLAAFFVLRAIVQVGRIYAQNRVAFNAGARLSARLARGYLMMPYSFYLQRRSSEMIRNAYQAVNEIVAQVFLPLMWVTAEAILVIAMLVLLALVAPLATVLAVVVLGSAAMLLLRVVQPRLKRLGTRTHILQQDTLGLLQQAIHGIRDIRILGREDVFADRFAQGRRDVARSLHLRATASELPRDIMELALIGVVLGIFAFSQVAGVATEATLQTLGVFAYVGLRIQPSLKRIIGGLNNVRFSSAPVDDVAADLEMVKQYLEEPPSGEPLQFRAEWKAEGVEFAYPGTDARALHAIDLSIAPGEVIGICGPTGGGKTTLVDVLTGLLDPTSGRVVVDGTDLQTARRSWHKSLGIVPQMVFLIDDTLRRNIALGVPDAEVDEEAMADTVRLAQLEEFVESLPDGLDTMVGERGVRVSGGQRQRIAIARALYRRPSVIVFDEGTSALDTNTEKDLMDALERLREDHTILLVAHRLATVRSCDRIFVIDSGRIVGVGGYEELKASNPTFQRLAASS